MRPSPIFSGDIKNRHCEPAKRVKQSSFQASGLPRSLQPAFAEAELWLRAGRSLAMTNLNLLCALCVSAIIILSSLPAQAADPGDACTAAQADTWQVSTTDPNTQIGCDGTRWRILRKIDESGAATSRLKQVITIGNDTATCNSDVEGTIRYNGTAKCVELCNATSWDCIAVPACADMTPDGLAFTDLANQALSTLVTSNIVEVTGLGCLVNASISGEGSPEYRICGDATCSSVTQDWTSGTAALAEGDYVQLRLTTSAAGGDTHTAHFFAGNAADVWDVTPAGDCTGTPAVGTICSDGTVYAGLSPDDGYVDMYVTRCDAGQSWNGSECTGTRFELSWNNGIYDPPWTETNYDDYEDGPANTAGLDALSDAGSPYEAAEHCANLDMHGHTDWYLPARDELDVIYDGKDIIQNFDTSGTAYWSSSESYARYAWRRRFSGGGLYSSSKHNSSAVRCARRGGCPTSGLVAHWKFDESSGITASDSAGSNDGTLANMDGSTDWVTGKIGNALDFDGTDDIVNAGSPAELDDFMQKTICAWVKWRASTIDPRIYVKDDGTGHDGTTFRLDEESELLEYKHGWTTQDGHWKTSNGTMPIDNTWRHVCVTYDAGSTANDPSFYINGTSFQVTEDDTPSGSVDSDASYDATIGNRPDLARTLDGQLDDVRVYDRVLSAEEISSLYSDGNGCW